MRDPAQETFERLFGPEFGHGKSYVLDNLTRALAALGEPQGSLPPVVHVAGTNGKGSTIAYMRAIAEAAGLRVHAFTKPHLFKLSERFLVAGAHASDTTLEEAARRVARAAPDLTQFEAQVAAALLLFAEVPADICLIETGLGGRDDATNVIARPRATVITPIGLDHQDVLGATLAEIAAHKAGILKPGVPAFTARQADEARKVLELSAHRLGAPLFSQGADWDAFAQNGRLVVQIDARMLDLPLPPLHGPHQADNAGLAVVAMLAIADFSDEALSIGLLAARWPGRLQPITRGGLASVAAGAELWVDGGHNEHAARALAAALADMNRRRETSTALIVAMRSRKDWRAFLKELAPHASQVIAVPLADMGVDPAALADYVRDLGASALTAPSLEAAISQAAAHGAGRILICGSLLLAAEALSGG